MAAVVKHVSIGVLSEVLEIIYHLQRNNLRRIGMEEVLRHCSKSRSYVKNTLIMLEELRFLEISADNHYLISPRYFKNINHPENIKLLIESAMREFLPFIEFLYLCSVGKSKEDASRIVKDVFRIESDGDTICKAFSAWIKGLNIEIDEITPSQPLILEKQERFNNRTQAILFIREQFGEDISTLQKDIIDDLIEALMDSKKDSSKTVNDAGRALEDFLRYYSKGRVDVSKCSGIIQISNALNQSGVSISSKKHNGILVGLGNIRSMGDAHGIDMSEEQRWTIKEDTALLYVAFVIKLMKSIIEYQKGILKI